jgi:hypothetical protein
MPSVNENESTAKTAAYGAGVDMISNPISGLSFPEAVVFQGITVQGVSTHTGSANFSQLTISGMIFTGSSGITIVQNVSGAATGGSGGTFSGLDPVGYLAFQTAAGAIRRIPYFT